LGGVSMYATDVTKTLHKAWLCDSEQHYSKHYSLL
jgi:hypothetical protein